jgi:hypothetical protein
MDDLFSQESAQDDIFTESGDQRDRETILDYFGVSKELNKLAVDVKAKSSVEIGRCHYLV